MRSRDSTRDQMNLPLLSVLILTTTTIIYTAKILVLISTSRENNASLKFYTLYLSKNLNNHTLCRVRAWNWFLLELVLPSTPSSTFLSAAIALIAVFYLAFFSLNLSTHLLPICSREMADSSTNKNLQYQHIEVSEAEFVEKSVEWLVREIQRCIKASQIDRSSFLPFKSFSF